MFSGMFRAISVTSRVSYFLTCDLWPKDCNVGPEIISIDFCGYRGLKFQPVSQGRRQDVTTPKLPAFELKSAVSDIVWSQALALDTAF